MNSRRKILLAGLVVALVLATGTLVAMLARVRAWRADEFDAEARSVRNIMRHDPALLLEACRTMIRHRHDYRNDLPNLGYNRWPPGTIILDVANHPDELDIPDIIRDLNPMWIEITRDDIVILVDRTNCWRKVALYAGGGKGYEDCSIELLDDLRIILRDGQTIDELTTQSMGRHSVAREW